MHILLILLFITPYFIVQFMPGKKSLLLFTAACLSFAAYTYYSFDRAETEEHGSPGEALGIAFLICMGYGAAAGTFIKTITLFMASRGVSLYKRLLAQLVFFLCIPVLFYASIEYDKWEHSMPSASCNYDFVTFSVSDQKFRLPSIEIVTATRGTGKEKAGDLTNFFAFYGAKDFRKFCEEFDNGQTPAKINHFRIYLRDIPRAALNKRFTQLCEQASWPQAICNHSGHAEPKGYPDTIDVYDKSKFNTGFIGGVWNHQSISNAIPKATLTSDIPGFAFSGHYYFWADENSPLALYCYKSNKGLYCRSDEKLSDNVYIGYTALVSLKNPMEDARKIRETTLNFIKLLDMP